MRVDLKTTKTRFAVELPVMQKDLNENGQACRRRR
jgi:hypothetical protein